MGEFVLLALLQEEEVEALLHLLLALVGEELAGLAGAVAHAGVGARLGAAAAGELRLQRDGVVVDGTEDVAALGVELAVEVLHEDILLGTALRQAVALQLGGVELIDLRLDAGLGQAGVRRQQAAAGVADVGRQVARDGQLVVQRLDVAAGFGGQLHVQAHGGGGVRDAMLAAERGDGAVHVAEFLFDDAQAVGDELVGGRADLVLVLDPDLVIHVDHHVQDLRGALDVDVLQGEVDDGGVAAAEGHAEAAQHPARGGVGAAAGDEEGAFGGGGVGVRRRQEGDAADGGLHGVLQGGADGLLAPALVIRGGESAEDEFVIADGPDGELGRGVVGQVQELEAQGQAVAVQEPVVAEVFLLVLGVDAEAPHHLGHEVGRLEVDDLVVDVHVALHEADAAEGRGGVGGDGAALAVFLDEDGRGAGVHRRRGEDVEAGRQEAEADREDEPAPFADAEAPEFQEAEGLLFVGRGCCHYCWCFCFVVGPGVVVFGLGCYLRVGRGSAISAGRSAARWTFPARRGSARRSCCGRCCR